ncbi:hypothetical protein GCM10008090_19970 [Arenicella chitinivorans]|uniref:DUF2914 domain-containing protein n=2 Tax=Arenicella chitinivorans TaxID=1329800 RepID=A0A918RUB7_9GAMM|nr:hypothetical protein GCM10008090_19970 [Arenicella chitinivorans]
MAFGGWVWLFIQPLVARRVFGDKHQALSSNVSNFLSQSIQQEIFFFALPFLFAALQWQSAGQIVFTGFIVAAALLSTIDPWYDRYISRHRLISFAFHALSSFVAALVILPIALKLPTEKTLIVALGMLVFWMVFATPKLVKLTPHGRPRALVVLAVCAVPALVWFGRSGIPAAGLEVTRAVIAIDVQNHEPVDLIEQLSVDQLKQGVYAHVAIKAPNGLTQDILFEWRHQAYTESIGADITGGREEGYRTYSMKSNFPESAVGAWFVDVRTAQGQLLRRIPFQVSPAVVP